MVQWLGSCTSASLGTGSIPGWTTKNLRAAGCSQKRQTKKQIIIWIEDQREGIISGSFETGKPSIAQISQPKTTTGYDTEGCVNKREKMTWQPKEKKEDKTKDNTVVPRKDGKDQPKT